MRFSLLTAVAAVAGMLYGNTASAAAWYVPSNTRIVQKDRLDVNGRVFGTIQGAINDFAGKYSCTQATPCVVKVMPGVYNEKVTMASWIDVAGSGPENTMIMSSVSTSERECDAGTVMMANDSTISDIRVVNLTPASTDPENRPAHVVGIAFFKVKAAAKNVHVWGGSDVDPAGRGIGICAEGEPAQENQPAQPAFARLDDVDVEGHGGSQGQGNAIYISSEATITVDDSRLAALAAVGHVNVLNQGGNENSSYVVNNCSIEGTAAPQGGIHGLWTGSTRTTVTNSRITLKGAYCIPFQSDVTFTIANSTINLNECASTGYQLLSTGRVANTMLPGDRSMLYENGAILVGNYDENFAPIANTLQPVP